MDILKLIKEKSAAFITTEHFAGIGSVVAHIEIAERHLNQGQKGDDYLFNDVVYRTNQAFEGSLKEAYNVLTGKKPEKETLDYIVKHLESSKLLKERVRAFISVYRTEWRNKSTHDYKLYFSEQEAFLAIVNISAFFNILLDPMLEKVAYEQEMEKEKGTSLNTPNNYSKLEFSTQVAELLSKFSKDLPEKVKRTAQSRLYEREVVGMLSAYLNAADPQIEVYTEYLIPLGDGMRSMRADFVLKKGDQQLIVELKRYGMHFQRRLREGREQLLSYMTAANIENGIVLIPPVSANQELVIKPITMDIANMKQTIFEIYPKNAA
jgi:hypothetical protein